MSGFSFGCFFSPHHDSPNAAANLETSLILEMSPSVNSYLTWKHYGDEFMRVYSIYECKFHLSSPVHCHPSHYMFLSPES